MNLHPDCAALAFLLGTWKGRGAGDYPTIDPFEYTEEVIFGHVGKPFLSYSQRTKHADTGQPLHAESGYLRALGQGMVEFVVVQPSGIVELHTGKVEERTLSMSMDSVQTTATAKEVTEVKRSMAVTGDELAATLIYEVSMAAVGQPLTHHLRAELVQQSP